MKYTIEGFSQQVLIELNLNHSDALILRWYVDFLPKMTSIEYENMQYKWVKYQAIIDDLPCLGITNKQVIARHFNKFVECGIMKKYIDKKGGIFTCYCLTTEYLTLVEGSTQKLIGIDSKVDTPINSKVETKDSSISINSSIKPIKEKTPKVKKVMEFNFEGFDEPEKEIITKWMSHLKNNNKIYKSQDEADFAREEMLKFKSDYKLVQLIKYCITRGWKAIYIPNNPNERNELIDTRPNGWYDNQNRFWFCLPNELEPVCKIAVGNEHKVFNIIKDERVQNAKND